MKKIERRPVLANIRVYIVNIMSIDVLFFFKGERHNMNGQDTLHFKD